MLYTPHRTKARVIILVILLALTVVFVFSNSIPDPETSAGESEKIFQLVRPLLEFFLGKQRVTHHLVRKLAHVAEFCAIGAELAVFALLFGKKSVGYVMFTGVFIALCDETVQIFSGRGSEVRDVWIDLSGILLGGIIVFSIFGLWQLFRRKETVPEK